MTSLKDIAKEAHHHARMVDAYGNDPEGAILDKIREETNELELAFVGRLSPNIKAHNLAIDTGRSIKKSFERNIKNTIPDEMADIILTTLAGAEELGIDIVRHINAKIAYNKIR